MSSHVSLPVPLKSAQRVDFDLADSAPAGMTSHAGRADPRALDKCGIETALRNHIVPLEPAGAVTPIACPDAATFHRLEPHLRSVLGPVVCRTKPIESIEQEILRLRAPNLARRAETRTAPKDSCRNWSSRKTACSAMAVVIVLILGFALAQEVFLTVLTIWSVLTLMALTSLRTAAAICAFLKARRTSMWISRRPDFIPTSELPRISLLVPLFDELNIAGRLVKRLEQLDYPRSKLDVCLILETGDLRTEAAINHAKLPDWMRIVHVPRGPVQTKPRAMNYALDFAKGEIIGIYDAEDKPARDQLRKIAAGFRTAGPDVACLQGVLEFYNARDSWLTRCFAIDYAAWFRLVLPGLVRLGFVIPLGGTTVFFRRSALEDLGRWDAHNVTEDADLGIRLARRGYRCVFVPTITEEEATDRVLPWLRQRSRWIKGYAITWAVHMRDPLSLLGDLGLKRFIGLQVLFFGTLSHFLLAPFLWSFWLVIFGLPHPVTELFSAPTVVAIASLFFLSELTTLLIAAFSVATPKQAWLIKWVPTMHLYFPLAAVASWKGFAELISRPFYWDKTAHGRQKVTRKWVRRFWQPLPRPPEDALQTRG